MFLKTGELKKIMKSSLKRHGLIVGNVNEHYLVYSDNWGVYVEHAFASNKFKAAIMELIGDLPEAYECYAYTIDVEKQIQQQAVYDFPDPFKKWKDAKDFTVISPILLVAWPHEYVVYQRNSDLKFLTALRDLTDNVISASELDSTSEHMPGCPSILDGVLYYKNESTIYWVHTESPGHKVLESLFPQLTGISFFEDDWLVNPDPELAEDNEECEEDGEAAGEQLPY